MRKSAKALVFVFVAFVGSLGLVFGAAFSAALAFGATALIVPGTGTHNVLTNTDYRNNAANRFINPAGVACSSTDGCNIQGVDYPAEFFPFFFIEGWCPGLQCDTWNTSVDTGVSNLDGALTPFTSPGNGEDVVIFGYSQGGAVVSREMYNLAGLDQSVKDRLSVVTIGNINNPRGLFARLGFLPTVPVLDISFGPNLPTDIGITSTNYSFEYDPVGDAPSYWGNPLAMLNALAAFEYVHGFYLVPNDNGPSEVLPYGYDNDSLAAAINTAANRRTYQDATFVLIPQRGALPLYQPVLDIGAQLGVSALVKPLVALVNPLTKLLVNLGYDRVSNPGIPQFLSILPFDPFTFNPVSFGVQFAQAVVQGVQDALAGGSALNVAPAPASTTLAARSISPQPAATLAVAPPARVAKESALSTTPVAKSEVASEPVGTPLVSNEESGNEESVKDSTGAAVDTAEEAAKAAAAKEAADKAAAKAAADEAAVEQAAAKAKDAANQAAADAAEDAADKAREAAADHAKEAAGNDQSAATGTGKVADDTGASADTAKAAA